MYGFVKKRCLFFALAVLFVLIIIAAISVNFGGIAVAASISYLDDYNVIVQDEDLSMVTVACGGDFTIGISTEGELYSWGLNDNGQLGNGNTTDFITQQLITVSGVTFTSIACGSSHSMALTSEGQLYTWGYNEYGQLGNNTTTDALTPQLITVSGATFASIAGGRYHSMALTTDGKLYTWGSNVYGQLGNDSATTALTPQLITVSGVTFASIACSAYHSMALTSEGQLYTWGSNATGELGNGTDIDALTPQLITVAGVTFANISCGYSFSTALSSDGKLYTWGSNEYGQLAISLRQSYTTPQLITVSGVTFTEINCGNRHMIALSSDGKLYTWGNNASGQLGIGTYSDQDEPTLITATEDTFNSVCASNFYTMALNLEGQLYAFGDNSLGNYGDGTLTGSDIPRLIVFIYTTCVTYDYVTNGGELTSNTIDVQSGTYADLTLTDSSAKFLGWNINNDATTALNTVKIQGNVDEFTLYAIYDKVAVTFPTISHVNFVLEADCTNPADYNSDFCFSVNYDSGYEAIVSLKIGATELVATDGIYTINNLTEEITITNNSSVVTSIGYTVAYNSNKPLATSGEISGETLASSHSYDTASVLTTNGYSLTGWIFSGWNTAFDGTGTSYTNGESVSNLTSTNGTTVILYAQWTAINVILTSNTLSEGVFDAEYSDAINTATGGSGSYSYSVINGTIPDGLSLNADTGAITGIVAAPGDIFEFTLKVTDNINNETDSATYIIKINKAVQAINGTTVYNITWGDEDFNLVLTAKTPVEYVIDTGSEYITLNGITVDIAKSGTAFITASAAADNYYEAAAPVTVTVNIAKRTVHIIIDNKSSIVGADLATLTYSIATDAASVVGGDELNIMLTKFTGDAAGLYSITGYCDNADYSIIFTDGIYILKLGQVTAVLEEGETVVVSSDEGFDPVYELVINDYYNVTDIDNILQAVILTYKDSEGNNGVLDGSVIVSIELSAAYKDGDTVKLIRLDADGIATEIECTVADGKMSFSTEELGIYAITYEENVVYFNYIFGIIAFFAVIITILMIITMRRRRNYIKESNV